MFLPAFTLAGPGDGGSPPYCLSSGRPATLVSRDSTPASADAEATRGQLTSPMAAAVPMVATAVWATVLTARTPAAFTHFFASLMLFHLLSILLSDPTAPVMQLNDLINPVMGRFNRLLHFCDPVAVLGNFFPEFIVRLGRVPHVGGYAVQFCYDPLRFLGLLYPFISALPLPVFIAVINGCQDLSAAIAKLIYSVCIPYSSAFSPSHFSVADRQSLGTSSRLIVPA